MPFGESDNNFDEYSPKHNSVNSIEMGIQWGPGEHRTVIRILAPVPNVIKLFCWKLQQSENGPNFLES